MRNKLILMVTIAAAVAAPTFSQGRSGGGVGNGPPISPPGQSGGMGSSERAGGIASQRGGFGRDFAEQRRLSAADFAEQRRLDVTNYRGQSEQRKAEALAYAQAARGNRELPGKASKEVRSALKADMESWRDTFNVDRKEWQAMRDQWLVDRETLTQRQWADQRASWFAARDSWIAAHKDWAQIYRN